MLLLLLLVGRLPVGRELCSRDKFVFGLCDRIGAILIFGVAIPLSSTCVANNETCRKKIYSIPRLQSEFVLSLDVGNLLYALRSGVHVNQNI